MSTAVLMLAVATCVQKVVSRRCPPRPPALAAFPPSLLHCSLMLGVGFKGCNAASGMTVELTHDGVGESRFRK